MMSFQPQFIRGTEQMEHRLRPGLLELHRSLEAKTAAFQEVLKIGRTHLQDATPIRLGQEFSGYASQVQHGLRRLESVKPSLAELALGGTAVGTGLNTHPEFAARTIAGITKKNRLGISGGVEPFRSTGRA
jgi:fumarate hydratase class II